MEPNEAILAKAREIQVIINDRIDKEGLARDLSDELECPGVVVVAVDLAQVASGKFQAHISASIPAEIIGTILCAVGEQMKRQYSGYAGMM